MSDSCPLHLVDGREGGGGESAKCLVQLDLHLVSAQCWSSPWGVHSCVKQAADTDKHVQSLKQNMFHGNNTDSKDPDLPNGLFQERRWLTQAHRCQESREQRMLVWEDRREKVCVPCQGSAEHVSQDIHTVPIQAFSKDGHCAH